VGIQETLRAEGIGDGQLIVFVEGRGSCTKHKGLE